MGEPQGLVPVDRNLKKSFKAFNPLKELPTFRSKLAAVNQVGMLVL
jgi:hypothetical protein